MIEWVQSFAYKYDLSMINAAICAAAAMTCIWVTQCMTRVPAAPWWAMVSILAHRALLLMLAASLILCGATPLMEKGAYPWAGDVVSRAVLLVLLLIWPVSSRARKQFGQH